MPVPKTSDFMIGFFEHGKYLSNELLSEEFMRSTEETVSAYAWFPAFSGVASPPKIFVLRKAS